MRCAREHGHPAASSGTRRPTRRRRSISRTRAPARAAAAGGGGDQAALPACAAPLARAGRGRRSGRGSRPTTTPRPRSPIDCRLIDALVQGLLDHALAKVFRLRQSDRRRAAWRWSRSAAMAAPSWRRTPTSICCSCTPTSAPPHTEQMIEFLLYKLWDLGLKVGQATRSVAECVRARPRRPDDLHQPARGALPVGRRRLCSTSSQERFEREVVGRRAAPPSSRPSSPSATPATSAPATAATCSSPTSRRARAACAICRPCSGSAASSTGSSGRRSWSRTACSTLRRCAGSPRPGGSSGPCAAICTT